jgi:hypothetical protein
VFVAAKEITQPEEIVVVVRGVSELDAAMPIPMKNAKEVTPRQGRSTAQRIREMEKRISERDEEADLLAWRGVPRRLPKAIVRDIEPPFPDPMESDLHQIDGKPHKVKFTGAGKRDAVFLLAVSKADGQSAQTQQPVHEFLRGSDDGMPQTTKQQKSRVFRKTSSSRRPL